MNTLLKKDCTEQLLQRRLRTWKSNPKYVAQNMYLFRWESDFLCKMQSGYWIEVECKISVADFKHDFTKFEKHRFLESGEYWMYRHVENLDDEKELYRFAYPGYHIQREGKQFAVFAKNRKLDNARRPNYFWYCVPWFIADAVEPLVPDYAGLVVLGDCKQLTVRKKAPLLHKEKYDDNGFGLAEKYYYHWLHLLQNVEQNSQHELINRLRAEISFIKAEYKAATGVEFKEYLNDAL